MSSYGEGSHDFRLGKRCNPYESEPKKYREREWWWKGWRDAKAWFRHPDMVEPFRVGDRVRIRRLDINLPKHTLGKITRIDGAYIFVRPHRRRWEVELYPNEIEHA